MIGGGEEVVAKLVVEHDEALAVQMFAREQFAAISARWPLAQAWPLACRCSRAWGW